MTLIFSYPIIQTKVPNTQIPLILFSRFHKRRLELIAITNGRSRDGWHINEELEQGRRVQVCLLESELGLHPILVRQES
ncbi:hypothetical protein [Actinoallomurus sp. CA-150999]|uniref:hypothetical protein n=1 Tax=Actinoallomurus sp. CA-150999 TaxID=3239887 RepID=UPI003D92404B